MNAHSFAELMGHLISATGKKMATKEVESWRRLLSDIPDEHLKSAILRAACECEAFPSVALIRRLAAESRYGATPTSAVAWERVLSAVRRHGIYEPEKAREFVGLLAWRAAGGDQGWRHLCDMEADQRTHFAAQFAKRWDQLATTVEKRRALPARLRPKIDAVPAPKLPEPETKSLPAPRPAESSARETVRFRDIPPPVVVSEADIERRKADQERAAKALIRRRAEA